MIPCRGVPALSSPAERIAPAWLPTPGLVRRVATAEAGGSNQQKKQRGSHRGNSQHCADTTRLSPNYLVPPEHCVAYARVARSADGNRGLGVDERSGLSGACETLVLPKRALATCRARRATQCTV